MDSGNFAFTASEGGDYTACFWAALHNPPISVTVEFDWRTGVAAKDWSKVAKKGQVEVSSVCVCVCVCVYVYLFIYFVLTLTLHSCWYIW